MGCQENYQLADNPDRPDWIRRDALANLIRQACTDHLFRLVDNPDRPDWLRSGALDGLCAFAQAKDATLAATISTLSVGETTISIAQLSIDFPTCAQRAAGLLHRLADNPDRPDSLRRRALEALAGAGCSELCLAIADNPDRPDWLRRIAMSGL